MKRRVLVFLLALSLTGCGNPSVIAYTRGMAIQKEADDAVSKQGKVDNKVEAKYFQAIEQYNSAIHFDPNLADAYIRRGLCRETIKQYDAAIGDYTEATRLEPTEPRGWARRGQAEMALQRYQDAVADFNAADNLSPGQEWIYVKRGYSKMYIGDLKGALADAQHAVELDNSVNNLLLLASAQRNLGHLDQMDEAFRVAVKQAPHNFTTYQNRAYADLIVGRYKQALDGFQTVLKSQNWQGTDAPYAVLLGWFCAKLSKKDADAKAMLDESVRRFQLPLEVDKNAHNALVANDWPLPYLQWLHGDITHEKLLRAAQGDVGKESELNCYQGLEALSKGDKKSAQNFFKWVVQNGRRDYVEWDLAKRLAD